MNELETRMKDAAANLEFEEAARLRDEIKIERIKALKDFKKDSMTGKFPGKKQSLSLIHI